MNRHLTSEQIADWMMGERAADAECHVRACLACRAEVEGLAETMAQFRDSSARWSAHHLALPTARRSGRTVWMGAAAAMAASVAAAAVLLIGTSRPVAPTPAPFIEIPYVAPLAPYERASVVRMDVPVAALIAVGFQVHGSEPGATISADVLVGQDGRPRAVRLISERSVIQ